MSTPKDPRIPILGAREIRHDIHFTILRGPYTISADGDTFAPQYAQVSWWEGNKARACVVIKGSRSSGGYRRWPASATFNLHGYTRRRPCPDWLLSLVRQAGYTGWATAASPRGAVVEGS